MFFAYLILSCARYLFQEPDEEDFEGEDDDDDEVCEDNFLASSLFKFLHFFPFLHTMVRG